MWDSSKGLTYVSGISGEYKKQVQRNNCWGFQNDWRHKPIDSQNSVGPK